MVRGAAWLVWYIWKGLAAKNAAEASATALFLKSSLMMRYRTSTVSPPKIGATLGMRKSRSVDAVVGAPPGIEPARDGAYDDGSHDGRPNERGDPVRTLELRASPFQRIE